MNAPTLDRDGTLARPTTLCANLQQSCAGQSCSRPRPPGGAVRRWLFWLLCLLGWLPALHAAQIHFDVFDVFIGYDGIIPEASWFPVVCEIENKGPSFNAVFELSSGQQGPTRTMALELPTSTLKRFVLPVFSVGRYNLSGWTARLLDDRGRVRAEAQVRQARRQNLWQVPLMGAVLHSAEGRPVFPDIKLPGSDSGVVAARLQPDLFPDNPIALEGLASIYLNSEQAMEDRLKVNQVNALLAWLYAGGHLIVGVQEITHVNGTEWLRRLLPCDLTGMTSLQSHAELQEWLRSDQRIDGRSYVYEVQASQFTPQRPPRRGPASSSSPAAQFPSPFAKLNPDAAFEQEALQIATGTLRDGRVLAGSESQPLLITARRGRGQVTVLTFSPERKPFTEWQHRPYFWAKVANLPAELLAPNPQNRYYPASVDGVFGSMIDSKQVRKLPVEWLLALLVGYLVVIGPLDRWWLKKINRQMLTWLTFPAYVAFFSLLIYFIGYKLRAGESEFNELHVVDVIPVGERADLRGRTFASIYSPANARYPLASELPFAALRAEFLGSYAGGQEAGRASVQQRGNNFTAEVSVPVWTSQLYVNDWWSRAPAPLEVSVQRQGNTLQVQLHNRLDRKLTQARLVVNDQVLFIGEIPPNQTTTRTLSAEGQPLRTFVQSNGQMFQQAISSRRQAFGENRTIITDIPASAMATGFLSQLRDPNTYAGFITPPRFDLTQLVERGDAVLLAWAADTSPVKPFNKFSPRRSHRDTLWRVACEVAP